MPFGASAGRARRLSSGPMRAIGSRSRTSCRRSKPRSRTACRRIPPQRRLQRPTRRRTTIRAASWFVDGGAGLLAMPPQAQALVEYGRAKVNLTLRVVGRRVDGYHDLESVVAFADCADRLALSPARELTLDPTGPLAGACGATSDNLVLKAARLLAERVDNLALGAFTLEKVLPVAAGIGGGSA